MKNQRILKIFPLLIVASILLLGSCNKVSQIRSSEPRHSIVVIHSWDSIGEEKELFSRTMERAFKEHGMQVDIHHIYANMLRRPNDAFSRFDWPAYSKQIKEWKPEVIL